MLFGHWHTIVSLPYPFCICKRRFTISAAVCPAVCCFYSLSVLEMWFNKWKKKGNSVVHKSACRISHTLHALYRRYRADFLYACRSLRSIPFHSVPCRSFNWRSFSPFIYLFIFFAPFLLLFCCARNVRALLVSLHGIPCHFHTFLSALNLPNAWYLHFVFCVAFLLPSLVFANDNATSGGKSNKNRCFVCFWRGDSSLSFIMFVVESMGKSSFFFSNPNSLRLWQGFFPHAPIYAMCFYHFIFSFVDACVCVRVIVDAVTFANCDLSTMRYLCRGEVVKRSK